MKSLSGDISHKFSSQMRGFSGEMQEMNQISIIWVLNTTCLEPRWWFTLQIQYNYLGGTVLSWSLIHHQPSNAFCRRSPFYTTILIYSYNTSIHWVVFFWAVSRCHPSIKCFNISTQTFACLGGFEIFRGPQVGARKWLERLARDACCRYLLETLTINMLVRDTWETDSIHLLLFCYWWHR